MDITKSKKRVFFKFVLLLMLLLSSVVTVSFFMNSKTNTVHSENLTHQTSSNLANIDANNASQDLVNQATHIVIGEVKNSESRWDEAESVISSYVRISVENHLKGNSESDEIIVKHKGGEVGSIGLVVSTEPRFEKSERVKVFLKSLEEANEFAVVGGRKGKISFSSSASASAGYSYDGYHWAATDLPVEYYINENGTPDAPDTEEFLAVQASFQTWEDDAGSYMDYTYMGTTTRSGASQDGFNVVSWESIDGPSGTLAKTYYWYEPLTKLLLEFDIVFDEDETWSASGEPLKHDIQNVGTHEVGHTLVLNDLYDLTDNEETMYGYSYLGETKKRDLYTGDIAGIRFIYGLATITYTIDTNPTGLKIEVDGTNYTTPYSFSWFLDSEHIVNAVSPQNQNAGIRYVFEKWSDGGAQSHSVKVGTSGASLIADYTLQYQISIRFKTDDNAQEIHPTQIQILGGPPNNTLITLTSYSNVWLDDVQWTNREIFWQKNNVVPLTHPTTRLSANFEWTVKSRVYPTWFNRSFKDSSGLALPINPSSFKLEFPNGTISNQLYPSDFYYIQNGTTTWISITWQSTEVAPANTVFDAANGNPTVNCLIYDFTIRVNDLFGLPVLGASVSVVLPNGTTISASTGTDGTAFFTKIPQGKFTAKISYIGQTTTIKGDVANAAAYPVREKITFSLPVILFIFVPIVSACLLILIVRKRITPASQTPPEV